MAPPDPYQVLGVPRDAGDDEIRAAFRRLAKAAHPDASGSPGLYEALVEARDTLLDPTRRRALDAPPPPPPTTTGPTTTGPTAPGEWVEVPADGDADAWVEVPADRSATERAEALPSPWKEARPVDLVHSLRSPRSWIPGLVAAAAVVIRGWQAGAYPSPSGVAGYVVGALVGAVLVSALWPTARSAWRRHGWRHGLGTAVVVAGFILVAFPQALALAVFALVCAAAWWVWRRHRQGRPRP